MPHSSRGMHKLAFPSSYKLKFGNIAVKSFPPLKEEAGFSVEEDSDSMWLCSVMSPV